MKIFLTLILNFLSAPPLIYGAENNKEAPLSRQPLEKILKEYTIVGDFNLKPEIRKVSDEVFWRYPFKIPRPTFPFKEFPGRIPLLEGLGRPYEHMNLGRRLFDDGQFEEAKKTWLSLRARYGETFPMHRRNDFLIGMAFLKEAMAKDKPDALAAEIRVMYSNAATFFSYAFQVKKAFNDSYVEEMSPYGLYNLAATYFKFDRFPAAFGAATEGLDFLRVTGRKEVRADLHSILAESYILNRSYLEAAQELDTALRQDPSPELAFRVFTRIGDIYLDLNNFELAEEAYDTGLHIGLSMDQIPSFTLAARGESLFWTGNFKEARKHFKVALESRSHLNSTESFSKDIKSLASLRLADSFLAEKDFASAKLAYFEHLRSFPDDLTAIYAQIRLACLELPEYKGNNITHARSTLAKIREKSLIKPARELAWSCEVASYTQRERTESMLERVKKFAAEYPNSRFLASFHEPVRESQAVKIEEFVTPYEPYGLISFYEANQAILFKTVPAHIAQALFRAYIDTHQIVKAQPFSDEFLKISVSQTPESVEDALRLNIAAAETSDAKLKAKLTKKADSTRAQLVGKLPWNIDNELKLVRILQGDQRPITKSWILEVKLDELKRNRHIMCPHILPLMSELVDEPIFKKNKNLITQSKSSIENELKRTFLDDFPCAMALLNLELKLFGKQTESFVDLLLKRDYIPFNEDTSRFYLSLATSLENDGNEKKQIELLQFIADKKDNKFPAVRFAREQLKKIDTQTGKLWR